MLKGSIPEVILKSIGVRQAKDDLSRILVQVEAGQTFLITRNGQPIAKLCPTNPEVKLGLLRGQAQVPDDFDSMDAAEIQELFLGTT